jgi:hypothetical protein
MAQWPPRLPDTPIGEQDLLARLLGLYDEERQLYAKVLDLSRQQGMIVSRRGTLGSVRRVLEQKKQCLDLIGRLEMTEHRAKVEWEKGRAQWSTSGRRRLHEAVQEVTRLIEEILICEEKNDLILIEQTRVV